jgi:hypothetical protein
MRPGLSSLFGLVALLSTAALAAQDEEPEEGFGAPFLLFPVGARATALGQAAAADGGSSEAAFWNPAGLAYMANGEVAVHFARTFVSDNSALAAYFTVSGLGVFGASAYLVDYGSQDVVTGPGVPVGRISPKNIELLGSFATSITGSLFIGVNYKLIQLRQDCSGQCANFPDVSGTTHGVDVGVQYAAGANDALRIGFVVRHAGLELQLENEEQADPLPTRVQLGASYTVLLPALSGTDQRFDARIIADVDDRWGQYDSPDVRVGLDVGLGELVRFRGGYAFLDSESEGPSVGVGLRVGRIAVDLARVFFVSSSFDEPFHISVRAGI